MADLRQLESIFLAALEIEGDARRRYLDEACAGDSDIRQGVEEMLAADARTANLFSNAIERSVTEVRDDTLEGVEVGPYRIIREIGRGGMGAVYLAERADAQFEKRVAVKVIKRGLDWDELLHRFRQERQILARLEHPNIAGLLDGGSLPDGRPYLIMEYVDGEPLIDHCSRRNLSAAERCRIFAKVCDAVAFAHRNLVVHRDLKPGNILVTPEGTPKLLDFGIAKLAEPGADAGATAFQHRMLTPEYASPEQVLGQPATTATDVYALGAILFHLLAGSAPHQFSTRTHEELRRVVCAEETRRPSRVAGTTMPGRLHDDLDRIVLMAMRKEPNRRYASVDQLREDLERHFAGQPVLAHEDSLGYRTGKFVRRNAFAVAAGVALSASILSGVLLTHREARIAAAERRIAIAERDRADALRRQAVEEHDNAETQRRIAVAERDRAEAESKSALQQRGRADERLQDIVKLANTSFFDVNDALSRTSGTTETRRKVIESALTYLDHLSSEKYAPATLTIAIVHGYNAMGDALGAPGKPNLGDFQGALRSYRKAAAEVKKLGPGDEPARSILDGDVQPRMVQRLYQSGEVVAAREIVANLQPRLDAAVQRFPRQQDVLRNQADGLRVAAAVVGDQDPRAAVRYARLGAEAEQRYAALYPKRDAASNYVGGSYSTLSQMLRMAGEYDEALVYAKKALETREVRVAQHPDDIRMRRELMMSYVRLADLSGGPVYGGPRADERAAREFYGKSVSLAEAMLKADPDNPSIKEDYTIVLMRFAACRVPERREESIAALRRTLATFDADLQRDPASREKNQNRAINLHCLARALDDSGSAEALEVAARAVQTTEAIVHGRLDSPPMREWLLRAYDLQSRVLARTGNRTGALELAQKAIRFAEEFASKEPRAEMVLYPGTAWAALGGLHAYMEELPGHDATQEAANSVAAYRRALEEFRKANGADPRELARRIATTETALAGGQNRAAAGHGTGR